MNSNRKRIPLSWPVRWRRIRRHVIPVACFVLALWTSGQLWLRKGGVVHAIGEVETQLIQITSPTGGEIVDMNKPDGGRWQTLDWVDEGDLLARLKPLDVTDSESESEESTKTIDIRAPLSGTIVSMPITPGQTVAPGTLLATITSEGSGYVISHVPEESRITVKAGQKVTLRSRSSRKQVITRIESVGEQIQPVPAHQVDQPSSLQWGTPVRIRIPDDAPSFVPGALVDVIYLTHQNKNRDATEEEDS